jgi:DNA-directed RNA polymerase specialized sigma subunit
MEKSELKNYRAIVMEVQQLKEQLVALESSLYSPKGQRFTSTPRVSSGERSTMDGAVARHVDLERKYREALAEKEAQQIAIEQAIQSLGDTPERIVMRERYLAGKGWPAIINKLQRIGVSERQVYRLHGLALVKLKELSS